VRRRLVTLLAACVLLAACANGDPGAATEATPVAGPANSEAPDALQLTAPLVGGGTVDLTEYAGTTVALWFWAPT
jgi:hypothetical protein